MLVFILTDDDVFISTDDAVADFQIQLQDAPALAQDDMPL